MQARSCRSSRPSARLASLCVGFGAQTGYCTSDAGEEAPAKKLRTELQERHANGAGADATATPAPPPAKAPLPAFLQAPSVAAVYGGNEEATEQAPP